MVNLGLVQALPRVRPGNLTSTSRTTPSLHPPLLLAPRRRAGDSIRGTCKSMPPKRKKRKTAKFLKPDRLSLIEDLRKKKYNDVIEKCINIAREGVQVKYCDSRRRLIDELTKGKARKVFLDFLKAMIGKYIALLALYTKGKRFARFEQAWLCHIEEYFTTVETPQLKTAAS